MFSKEKLRILGFITIVMVVIGLVVAMVFLFRSVKANDEVEATLADRVKAAALADLDLPEDTDAEIRFVHSEPIRWNDYDLLIYILTVGDNHYLVGVQAKDGEIHYVDAECELEDHEVAEWEEGAAHE